MPVGWVTNVWRWTVCVLWVIAETVYREKTRSLAPILCFIKRDDGRMLNSRREQLGTVLPTLPFLNVVLVCTCCKCPPVRVSSHSFVVWGPYELHHGRVHTTTGYEPLVRAPGYRPLVRAPGFQDPGATAQPGTTAGAWTQGPELRGLNSGPPRDVPPLYPGAPWHRPLGAPAVVQAESCGRLIGVQQRHYWVKHKADEKLNIIILQM